MQELPTQILDPASVAGVHINGRALRPAAPRPGRPGPYALRLNNGETVTLENGTHGPAVRVRGVLTHLGAGVLDMIETARRGAMGGA